MPRGRKPTQSPGPVRQRMPSHSPAPSRTQSQSRRSSSQRAFTSGYGGGGEVDDDEIVVAPRRRAKRADTQSPDRPKELSELPGARLLAWSTRTLKRVLKILAWPARLLLLIWILMWAWLLLQSTALPPSSTVLVGPDQIDLSNLHTLLDLAAHPATSKQSFTVMREDLRTISGRFYTLREHHPALRKLRNDAEEMLDQHGEADAGGTNSPLTHLWGHITAVDLLAQELERETRKFHHFYSGAGWTVDLASCFVPPLFPFTLSGVLVQQMDRFAREQLPEVENTVLMVHGMYTTLDDLDNQLQAFSTKLAEHEDDFLQSCYKLDRAHTAPWHQGSMEHCREDLGDVQLHVNHVLRLVQAARDGLRDVRSEYQAIHNSHEKLRDSVTDMWRIPHVYLFSSVRQGIRKLVSEIEGVVGRRQEIAYESRDWAEWEEGRYGEMQVPN